MKNDLEESGRSLKPPLKPLHSDDRLIQIKLNQYDKLTTDELIESLLPGKIGSLKTRPDGTIIDGHHRIKTLQRRGFDVDNLPRDVIRKDDEITDLLD